ncbi:MAG: transcriptional regulator [Treponema sp.]|nr:transcriptional regulator [Treponema sp.]
MDFVTHQTEDDFLKAHNKALLNGFQHILSPEEAKLISLNDVKHLLKPTAETYVGMKVIPIEKIVGSEGRYNDFDNKFFPKSTHLRNRWERVDAAAIQSIDLPPIKVYEISGLYFVRDGNHRVSVAKTRGVEFIDAEVVSLQSEIKLKNINNVNDIIRQIIYYEKRVFYAETAFGDITDYWCLDFSSPGRYDVVYNHILTHKYFMNQDKKEEVTMEEAIESWFNNVYYPLISIINRKHTLRAFPHRTLGDLYVWIVRYWDDIKQKYGDNIPMDEAVSDFKKKYKFSIFRKIKNKISKLILRKSMTNNQDIYPET